MPTATNGNGEVAIQRPKSLDIAERGIRSSGDFRDLMSELMSDVIGGALSPQRTNAACNAGGKLLKMLELEYKYSNDPNTRSRRLAIAFDGDEEQAEAATH